MTELQLLAVYCLALVVVAFAGGALPQRIAMTHTRTQLAMSLVSGLMLGIAFFHLLPHAVVARGVEGDLTSIMVWVLVGLVVMLLMLRLLHFHYPDYSAEASTHCDHDHNHSHHHPDDSSVAMPALAPNWQAVLLGLSFHTLIDGIALGSAILATSEGHTNMALSFGVFLAILLHKPLDAMSITALMKAAGTSASTQQRAILAFALICPIGAFAFYGLVGSTAGHFDAIVASALAFSAGAFICIALSDLLPEVQFHSHDRGKLTAIFLLGIAIAYVTATSIPGHSHSVDLSDHGSSESASSVGTSSAGISPRHTH